MAQRNFSKQMWNVQNLELPPSYGSDYVVTEFKVEEWAGGTVHVARAYRAPSWHGTFACHEAYTVGPRGAVKRYRSDMY